MKRSLDEFEGPSTFNAGCFADERGFLLQSYTESGLSRLGIPSRFRQAIQSRSRRGTVRGLHFQWKPPQGKLIRCVSGRIFDVIVDLRLGSPTLGDHASIELDDREHKVLWVPPGFAHGFMALEESATVLYECTEEWAANAEGGILWNDPALGIGWPDLPVIVSAKDRAAPTLARWLENPAAQYFSV